MVGSWGWGLGFGVRVGVRVGGQGLGFGLGLSPAHALERPLVKPVSFGHLAGQVLH